MDWITLLLLIGQWFLIYCFGAAVTSILWNQTIKHVNVDLKKTEKIPPKARQGCAAFTGVIWPIMFPAIMFLHVYRLMIMILPPYGGDKDVSNDS